MGKQGILLVLFSIIILANGCSLFKETQKIPFPDYLTPMMYGAKGDGKKDDTDALRRAIYESDRQGKVLYLPSGYKFDPEKNYYEYIPYVPGYRFGYATIAGRSLSENCRSQLYSENF